MTVLGPVYPAFLAPGLRVCHVDKPDDWRIIDGVGPSSAGREAPWWCYSPTRQALWFADRLRIDYGDPHTRDRVQRALALAGVVPDDASALALRAAADVAWGKTVA